MKLLAFSGLLALAPLVWAEEQAVLDSFCPPGSVKNPADNSCTEVPAAATDAAKEKSDSPANADAEAKPLGQWSAKPKCLRRKDSDTKYCVFTDSQFGNGRGISFMHQTNFTGGILEIPALKDSSVLDEGVNVVLDKENVPYERRPIPGKGIGLVATRPIMRGSLIMATTPLLLLEENMMSTFEEEHTGPFLDLAVKQLPEKSAELVTKCKGHFGGHHVADVVNTNAFAVSFPVGPNGDNVGFNALLPESAMLNHDCRPNTHYWFDNEKLIHYIYALRTIIPGEELTNSYIDIVQISQARKGSLKRGWGFDCNCNACKATQVVQDASDVRVAQIQLLSDQLRNRNPDSEASVTNSSGIDMAELLVSLYQVENMWGPLSEGYAFAALEYTSAENKWKAAEYAHKAIESGLLYSGPKDIDVRSMLDLLTNPEGHWSWGVREKQRKKLLDLDKSAEERKKLDEKKVKILQEQDAEVSVEV